MTPDEKRQQRAAANRALACASEALAAASVLDNVREKHGLAALRWRELAAMDERGPASAALHPPAYGRRRRAPTILDPAAAEPAVAA